MPQTTPTTLLEARDLFDRARRSVILQALYNAGGHVSNAAKTLGILPGGLYQLGGHLGLSVANVRAEIMLGASLAQLERKYNR